MRPPYDPYAAKPEVVRSHADTIVTKSTLIGPVNTAFLQQKAAAAENVTGELVDELDEAFKGVSADSDQIAIASAFVAGTLYTWADAIATFNTGVDGLNKDWENRPAGPSGGLSPAAIEQQIIKDLNTRWGTLDSTLDVVALDLKSELDKGPDAQSVLEYFATGALPESALPLLAGLGIDPKEAKEVLDAIRGFIRLHTAPGSSLSWKDVRDAIEGADPRIAAVVLGALSDDEINALGNITEDESNNSDFYNFILAGATREQIDRIKALWPGLRPQGGENWYVPGDPLFRPPYAGNSGTTIGAAQGGFDDCWMFAKLNAIVGADPTWPQRHVIENPNGTVSVKFYDGDGDPYWVTVTDELPRNGAEPEGSNSSTWAAYYEKAMAIDDHSPGGLMPGQGYDNLTAGLSDSADEHMTGQESDNLVQGHLPWSDDPYPAVKEAYQDGKGIVVGNWGNDMGDDGDDDMHTFHVYYVKEIQADGDIVLGNPWGYDDVTLTEDEFNTYAEDVSVVKQ